MSRRWCPDDPLAARHIRVGARTQIFLPVQLTRQRIVLDAFWRSAFDYQSILGRAHHGRSTADQDL